MNETMRAIRQAAREQMNLAVIEKLKTCTDKEQELFKKMYAGGDLTKPIEAVVRAMPEEKMDWALTQIENTLKKRPRTYTCPVDDCGAVHTREDIEEYTWQQWQCTDCGSWNDHDGSLIEAAPKKA